MKDVIQMFIEAGRTTTALTEAARWGEIDLLLQLLESGLSVDARDENGGTALMNAASAGNLRIIRLLIDRGADANATDHEQGKTPLMWGLVALHDAPTYLALTQELLKSGALVGLKDPEGRTALDYARSRRISDLEHMIESALHLEEQK